MSAKIPVNTDKAPKALPGMYNQAIVANGMVFCSGAVALDKDTMMILDGDVKAHTVGFETSVDCDKVDQY
jgi:enamine deaminase RidA (YjgF/YER057c/UK114 family)